MADDKTIFVRVSAVKNVWLRRLAIVLTLPLMAAGNVALGLPVAVYALWRVACNVWANQVGMARGAREQWRRKDAGGASHG